ncbi:U3 small nucleolar ribonucleoprotein protein imp4 [Striga asiatica]|uniref:U3 small nucleolar ribonucleoprotein protein imp4 n=1 Tax=Striga asiatica TaxID=4170 RepID=A0A5A7PGW8_STRAF|nr:U3 small nucleolar ribonucleoprotein protein imp4 [Striga asiatica]
MLSVLHVVAVGGRLRFFRRFWIGFGIRISSFDTKICCLIQYGGDPMSVIVALPKPYTYRVLLAVKEEMLRRNVRLGREYLYRKSFEGKEHLLYEKKHKIREAFAENQYQPSSEMKRGRSVRKLTPKMKILLVLLATNLGREGAEHGIAAWLANLMGDFLVQQSLINMQMLPIEILRFCLQLHVIRVLPDTLKLLAV